MNTPAIPISCALGLIALVLSGCGYDPVFVPPQPDATESAPSPDQTARTDNEAGAAAERIAERGEANGESGTAVESAKPAMSDDAFRLAAHDGKVEVVQRGLKSGVPVDAAEPGSQLTALHMAALNGHTDTVRLLLRNKALVDSRDGQGHTPLHMAAYNGHTAIVEQLLDAGASVDARDAEGKTPLIHACTGAFAPTVEALLDAGAEINTQEATEGFTPLMMAAGLGEVEVVKVLLKHNADKSILDNDRRKRDSAADHARNAGHAEIVELLK